MRIEHCKEQETSLISALELPSDSFNLKIEDRSEHYKNASVFEDDSKRFDLIWHKEMSPVTEKNHQSLRLLIQIQNCA